MRNLDECVVDLVAHQRRVGIVQWHPTSLNTLLSSGELEGLNNFLKMQFLQLFGIL